MNTIEKTAGNAFTRDPDYAKFTGKIVHVFHTTYYDPKEKVFIKRTVEYIDVGRPSPVEPVDVDSEMASESWNFDNKRVVQAAAGKRNALLERDKILGSRVEAHLRQYGATTARDLAENVGISQKQMATHLREHTDKYVKLEGAYPVWGLVGVDYGIEATMPPYVQMFKAALLEHGPMTMTDLCRAANITKGSASVGMTRFTDIFTCVGYTKRKHLTVAVWGLVGIHDQGGE